jgi:hypothetical protein
MKYKKYGNRLSTEKKSVISLFLASGLTGMIFWLIDYHGCDFIRKYLHPFNPYGHAIWHLSMGYFAYLSIILLRLLEDIKNERDVKVIYHYRFIPFIITTSDQIKFNF